jgi:hypothetical protein
MCWFGVSLLVLFHLHTTLENQDFEKALVSAVIKELLQGGLNWVVAFSYLATDCSLLPAIF